MAKKDKKSEAKLILEREYIVPLRRQWLKVAEFKRANRAVKELKRFLAKHMKVYDRDLRKIKIDNDLNNEMRFRGMRKPPAKIRVKAKKFDDGIVRVSLVDIPEHVKYARLREAKLKKEIEKKVEKIEEKKEEVKETKDIEVKKEDKEKKEEAKEKEEASKDASIKIAEEQAKQQKHVSMDKDMQAKQNIGGKRSQRGR